MHGRPCKPLKEEDESVLSAKAEKLRLLQSQFLANHQNRIYSKEALDFASISKNSNTREPSLLIATFIVPSSFLHRFPSHFSYSSKNNLHLHRFIFIFILLTHLHHSSPSQNIDSSPSSPCCSHKSLQHKRFNFIPISISSPSSPQISISRYYTLVRK
ncbi:unnamed protein product [Trifolium pratense]|uniref:Uncharacterized protein n=1 Tax=Trifolium pratense TaxID=57577 RepID=A0ACB0J5P0_TRIPR|nr:unnamed protein product [Trifolium pratense]